MLFDGSDEGGFVAAFFMIVFVAAGVIYVGDRFLE